ncbi:MAG: hypothetical protein AAGJ34_08195 [Pseudomonadota bacterium]
MSADLIASLLDVSASIILAVAALFLAWKANTTSQRAVTIERDKHILEWGQRCLVVISQVVSLRLKSRETIELEEFNARRRAFKADLYALREEGTLFFLKDTDDYKEPCLVELWEITKSLDGRIFKYPEPGEEYSEQREPQMKKIRGHTRAFISAIQKKVGTEWLIDANG